MIERAPLLHRAMLCTAFEAANQDWVYGTVNGSHLLTHVATPLSRHGQSSSLPNQVKHLLMELKCCLDEGKVTEYLQPYRPALTEMSKSDTPVLMNDVNGFLNDKGFLDRVGTIEDIISKKYPGVFQAAQYQRQSSGTRLYRRQDIVGSEAPNEVDYPPDYHSTKELSPIREDVEEAISQLAQGLEGFQGTMTSRKIVAEESVQKKVTNGMVFNGKMDINGNCKGYSNGKANAAEPEEPRGSIWRSIGILSISLVIFVVAGAFLFYFLQEKDFNELLKDLKDFSSWDESEL